MLAPEEHEESVPAADAALTRSLRFARHRAQLARLSAICCLRLRLQELNIPLVTLVVKDPVTDAAPVRMSSVV